MRGRKEYKGPLRDLGMHILDLVENSFRAGATLVEIDLEEDDSSKLLTLSIRDNGKGVPRGELEKLLDPFYTTKEGKRVGLGIPMLNETCKRCGGSLFLDGDQGKGLSVKGVMRTDNIDLPPYGDLASTISTLLISYPSLDFYIRLNLKGKELVLDTKDIRGADYLEPTTIYAIREVIKEFLSGAEQKEDRYAKVDH